MVTIPDIHDKFNRNESLTDKECLILFNAFKAAADACLQLGERYRLPFLDANENTIRLYEICKARGLLEDN